MDNLRVLLYDPNVYVINHNDVHINNEINNELLMNNFTKDLCNWYPIGNDKFTIDYSEKYFNFFKSLGSEGFHVVYKKNNKIYGSLCARFLRNAWYFCDLKVAPKYRGKKLTYKLLLKKCISLWFKSNRGYALSMYPNNAVKMLNDNFKLMQMRNMGFVYIYLVDYNTIVKIYDKLVKYYNHKYNGFLNINNMKKLVLNKDYSELNVLHFYHKNINFSNGNDNGNGNNQLTSQIITFNDIHKYKDYKFFYCVLEKDLPIIKLNLNYYGLCTLYARKMQITEFNDLCTHEI